MNFMKKVSPVVILTAFFILFFSNGLVAQVTYNEGDQNLRKSYQRANPIYLKAEKLFKKNNFEKALSLVQECLNLMPEHANASFLMAQIYIKQDKLPEALNAVILAKKNYTLLSQFVTFTRQEYLNSIQEKLENLRQQRSNLEEYVNSQKAGGPQKSQAQVQLNLLSTQINEIEKQLKSPIAPATDTLPANYHYIHGNIYFKMRRFFEAIEEYKKAIEIDPTHRTAYNNMSLVYYSMGKFQEAFDCLIMAESAGAQVNPDFKKALQEKLPK